jgi:hypothetical protein
MIQSLTLLREAESTTNVTAENIRYFLQEERVAHTGKKLISKMRWKDMGTQKKYPIAYLTTQRCFKM